MMMSLQFSSLNVVLNNGGLVCVGGEHSCTGSFFFCFYSVTHIVFNKDPSVIACVIIEGSREY